MDPAAIILGAGWSYYAGLPLARDLFDELVGGYTNDAAIRLAAVFWSFVEWRNRNPGSHAEEFIAAVYRGEVVVVVPETNAYRVQLELEGLSRLPWRWVVEYIQVRLAMPVAGETRRATARYTPQMHMPTRSAIQQRFWSDVHSVREVTAVVTTNYDLLAERTMRHREMKRPASPGFHYGGISVGSARSGSPFGGERYAEPTASGRVPLFKLHGSVNWALEDSRLVVYPDVRPAFRRGGTAAIIPPLPEKAVPDWLGTVWSDAERALARATEWVVVGYSLPVYDVAVSALFNRAATSGRLQRVTLYDPDAKTIAHRWMALAAELEITGFPTLA